jgi:Na+/alanine symporter
MSDSFFSCLELIDDSFWNYAGVPVLLVLGLYFSVKANFMQVTHFKKITSIFLVSLIRKKRRRLQNAAFLALKHFLPQ